MDNTEIRDAVSLFAQDCRRAVSNGWVRPKWSGPSLQGADLSGLNLSQARFDDSPLQVANFSHCNLGEATFCSAGLMNANFQDANLQEASFYDADLTEANLDGACFLAACRVGTIIDDNPRNFACVREAREILSKLTGTPLDGDAKILFDSLNKIVKVLDTHDL
jgi:hypothetical protein